MRILVVVPALGAVYGGPSRSVVELAHSLGKAGIQVDLVTTNANGSAVVDQPTNQWIQKEYYRVKYFSYLGISDYKLSLGITTWLLQNVQNYDLVQINAIFSVPNLPAYIACQLKGVPYVVIPRGMLEPWAMSYKAWKKKVYYTLLEQPALQRASALQMLASSEAQQIEALKLSPQVMISANGVHRQIFEKLPSPEHFYQKFPQTRHKKLILFLGRIDPKKGFDFLAYAFGQLRDKFPEAHLVVAGPDNVGFLPTAKQLFRNNDCLDAVTFTGMLSGDLKYAALAAADCYIAPSYSEGFSMSVLEGMAAGLPCVITTGCNFPEAAEHSAAYVTDVDRDAIANALWRCFSEPQSAKEMGLRAKAFIMEKYTWDKIASQLLKTYQSIISTDVSKEGRSQHA